MLTLLRESSVTIRIFMIHTGILYYTIYTSSHVPYICIKTYTRL